MDIVRGVLAVLCVVTVAVCLVAVDQNQGRMVIEINRRLPPADRLPHFNRTLTRRGLARDEYRRLYPGGPLLRRERRLVAITMGSMALLAALVGVWPGVLCLVAGATALWLLTYGPDLRRKP